MRCTIMPKEAQPSRAQQEASCSSLCFFPGMPCNVLHADNAARVCNWAAMDPLQRSWRQRCGAVATAQRCSATVPTLMIWSITVHEYPRPTLSARNTTQPSGTLISRQLVGRYCKFEHDRSVNYSGATIYFHLSQNHLTTNS